MTSKVITEITPLTQQDSFYMFDHLKETYDYPLHKHEEIELTFMENCTGVRRVVGDSIETCGRFDLALIGSNLEHAWEQVPGETLADVAAGHKVRELVVQFSPDLLDDKFLAKSQMASLRKLMDNAKRGIAFGTPVIMRIYNKLDQLSAEEPGFPRVLRLLDILYQLSIETDFHTLATSSFASAPTFSDSRRVHKVETYINEHFREEIRLQTVADLAGMTPTAFSRFFRLRTNRTLSDYIIDMRLGYAARQLVDTTTSIIEICYASGFNNVSNFNRIFRKRKGCSPSDFRKTYQKNKITV
ncbi:MAG: helix-turn-helix domain-containing protein [Bacteroidales bacterium]|nr:helix-turn-helix domain-containing protein [Bacteroidales bacterium]